MSNRKIDVLKPLHAVLLFSVALWMAAFTCLIIDDFGLKWYEKPTLVLAKNGASSASDDADERIVDGIHLQTGLVYAKGFDIVRGTCTACHSAKLVTQNRATREGWKQMIVWMQETQGLWDLGNNQTVILDYLSKHYAPKNVGRRQNIDIDKVEWFILNLEE